MAVRRIAKRDLTRGWLGWYEPYAEEKRGKALHAMEIAFQFIQESSLAPAEEGAEVIDEVQMEGDGEVAEAEAYEAN